MNKYYYWLVLMMGVATNLNLQQQQHRQQANVMRAQQAAVRDNLQQQQYRQQQILIQQQKADVMRAKQAAVRDLAITVAQNQINKESNINIILKTAKEANKKGDYKQTIQITTDLLNNYPNLKTFSNISDAYIDRAKAFAAIGKKDLAIEDIQKFAIIARSRDHKELDPLLTKVISNLNRCGSMQCDKSASIKPQQPPTSTVRITSVSRPVVPARPVGVAAIKLPKRPAPPTAKILPKAPKIPAPPLADIPPETPKRPAPPTAKILPKAPKIPAPPLAETPPETPKIPAPPLAETPPETPKRPVPPMAETPPEIPAQRLAPSTPTSLTPQVAPAVLKGSP